MYELLIFPLKSVNVNSTEICKVNGFVNVRQFVLVEVTYLHVCAYVCLYI